MQLSKYKNKTAGLVWLNREYSWKGNKKTNSWFPPPSQSGGVPVWDKGIWGSARTRPPISSPQPTLLCEMMDCDVCSMYVTVLYSVTKSQDRENPAFTQSDPKSVFTCYCASNEASFTVSCCCFYAHD